MAEPQRLTGGTMGGVHRIGEAVRRPAGDWTPAVHRLLRHLIAAGVPGVPSPIEIAPDGTELIGYLPGDVPAYPMPGWVWTETALTSAARLLRTIHDATADLALPGPWRSPVRQPAEVICHNDFAPYNLVFADGRVVGAIDWDFASPGPRLWDLAYLAYRIVPLSDHDRADAFLDGERRQRLDLLLASYGTDATPDELLHVVRTRLIELAAFSDRMADELGRPELHEDAAGYRHDAEIPFW